MSADRKYRTVFGENRRPIKRRLMTVLRTREVRRVLQQRYERHGGLIPDDDAGRDDLAILLSYVVEINPVDAIRRAAMLAREYAPWLSQDDAMHMAEHALRNPIRLSADDLAQRLGVTDAMRTELRLTTIGATDVSKAERAERRRQRNKERTQASRRKKGVKPRAEHLANSLSSSKPWELEGISRATWYRRKRETDRCSPNIILLNTHLSQRDQQAQKPVPKCQAA